MEIPKISAFYETSLASALSASGTSFDVVSGTDRDGNDLDGLYGFVIDEGSADEEIVIGTISGTTVSISYRGIDADAPNTEVANNKKAHRRGASIKITDYPIMGILRNILNGDETLPNILKYEDNPTFSDEKEIVSKKYVDNLMIENGGVPDASATQKGVSKLSAAPENPTNPIAVGDNDPRIPTTDEKAALAGASGTPSASNKYLTEAAGVKNILLSKEEETSSGITAGNGVFLKSDGKVTKKAIISAFEESGIAATPIYSTSYNPFNLNLAWLTKNTFVIVYGSQIGSSSYSSFASVGSITDSGYIQFGTPSSIIGSGAYQSYPTVFRLSDSKFVVIGLSGNNTTGIVVCSVSGSTITVGSAQSFNGNESSFKGDRLTDSSFVFTYRDQSTDDCYVRAATVAGTTITLGTAVSFDTNESQQMRIVALTSTKAIVSWSNGSTTFANVATISGTTVTAGASNYTVFSGGSPAPMVRLADDKFAVTYLNTTIRVKIGTVSGDAITFGTETTSNASAFILDIERYGTGLIVSSLTSTSNPYPLQITYLTISGTDVTSEFTQLISSTSEYSQNYIVANIKVINGFLVICTKPNAVLSLKLFKPITNQIKIGVAKSTPDDNLVPIIHKGLTGEIFSDLTFGERYFSDQEGSVSAGGMFPIGTAISATEILME